MTQSGNIAHIGRTFFSLFMALAVGFTCFACSDDDDDTSVPTEEEETEEDAAVREMLRTALLTDNLCNVDTLADGTVQYTPIIGEVLDQATPSVRYVVADSVQEARLTWGTIVSALQDSAQDISGQNEVTQGDIHLTFTEGGADGQVASVNIDCDRFAEVFSRIVFITSDRWPGNDHGSPFGYLSVVKQKSTGWIYLCVRQAQQGQDGILMTFDGGVTNKNSILNTYWQGNIILWDGVATADAFIALCAAMCESRYEMTDAIAALEDYSGKGSNFRWLLEMGANASVTYALNYKYWDELVPFIFRWRYHVTINKITIYGGNQTNYKRKFHQWSDYFEGKKNHSIGGTHPHSITFDGDVDTNGWETIYAGVN